MTLAKTNPLQSLIQRAATAPAQTGETARHAKRIAAAGSALVVLADVSSSMNESAGSRLKIDVLREALSTAMPAGPRLIAFASIPTELASTEALPSPNGGTALHLALDLAATKRPARTLVISDGQPDSEEAAIAAADRLPGAIDVIYCGPDSDAAAKAFLMRLARTGGGRYVAHDLRREPAALGPAVHLMLTSGRP